MVSGLTVRDFQSHGLNWHLSRNLAPVWDLLFCLLRERKRFKEYGAMHIETILKSIILINISWLPWLKLYIICAGWHACEEGNFHSTKKRTDEVETDQVGQLQLPGNCCWSQQLCCTRHWQSCHGTSAAPFRGINKLIEYFTTRRVSLSPKSFRC